jgi:parvulin-like peptidyl-prolyl isomerase
LGGMMGTVNPDILPPDIGKAVRESQVKALLGPFKTDQGFEIYLVEDRQMQILKPNELQQAQAQAFTNWEISKLSADNVQTVSEVWKNAIPVDPKPEDVSPLLKTEHYSAWLKATSAP